MELSFEEKLSCKREKDFKAIFKDGTSFANRKFVVYQLENQQNHFRVGLSVSKKLGMQLPEIRSRDESGTFYKV